MKAKDIFRIIEIILLIAIYITRGYESALMLLTVFILADIYSVLQGISEKMEK